MYVGNANASKLEILYVLPLLMGKFCQGEQQKKMGWPLVQKILDFWFPVDLSLLILSYIYTRWPLEEYRKIATRVFYAFFESARGYLQVPLQLLPQMFTELPKEVSECRCNRPPKGKSRMLYARGKDCECPEKFIDYHLKHFDPHARLIVLQFRELWLQLLRYRTVRAKLGGAKIQLIHLWLGVTEMPYVYWDGHRVIETKYIVGYI